MKLYPNQLTGSLQSNLPAVMLVFGDEPMQQQQAIDEIRQKLVSLGADERISFTLGPQFDWHEVLDHFQAMSLFSTKKIVEIGIPSGKIDKNGQAILKDIAAMEQDDVTLILHGPRLGADQQRLAWFKALEKNGWFIQCYPLEGQRLNQWIQQRCQHFGVTLERDAATLLADFCEGNLLAASQEIEKLSLLFAGQRLSLTQVSDAIVDHSRFNVFQLVDAIHAGNADRALHIVQGVMEEGTDATVVLWALQREWQTLKLLLIEADNGASLPDLFKKHRIWQNRQGLFRTSMQRTSVSQINHILKQLSILDCVLKSNAESSKLHQLSHIIISMIIPEQLNAFDAEDALLA